MLAEVTVCLLPVIWWQIYCKLLLIHIIFFQSLLPHLFRWFYSLVTLHQCCSWH